MERATENKSHIKVYYDFRTLCSVSGSNRVSRLLVEDGSSEQPCRVTVKPTGDAAYELKGQVNSIEQRDMVLSFVRVNHPFRDIVDRVTVTGNSHHHAA